ncbi:ATP-dependent helicase BRM-like [Phragmites australis]|uniref:ATP-dependent helicase BRM-like n=1 Tax=Phragmites australis TaxID=29695 RepID=UPI002D78E84B|nr:ATP-dependent helicase BRM-like [Phragmites australis]
MQLSGGPSCSSRSSPATSPRSEQQQPAAAAAAQQQQQQSQQAQQLGFRSQGMMHHHEQQQAYQSGAAHGMMGVGGGSSFPQFSGPVPPFQGQRNLPQSGGGQMHNQVAMQQQAYLKFAMMQQQQQQQKSHGMLLQQHQQQQQAKMNMAGPSTRDQDMVNNPAKMQELMSLQAQMFKRQSEHLQQAEKQKDQGYTSSNEQKSGDMRPRMPPQGVPGQQLPSAGMVRPMQPMQGQVGMGSIGGSPLTPPQFQAIQAWAKEHNIDLSNPANMNVISQILPIWQSNRMATMQKQNEASMAAQQQSSSLQVNSDTPGHGNVPGQGAPSKPRQPLTPSSSVSGGEEAKIANLSNLQLQQQLTGHNWDGSNDRAVRLPMTVGNGGQTMQMPQSSGHVNNVPEQSNPKNVLANSEAVQMQYARQMQPNQAAASTATPGETGGSQAPTQGARPQTSFTKNQLHVLKAQILAFRRLKRGDRTLPPEVLELIKSGSPPDSQGQQVSGPLATHNRERPSVSNVGEHGRHPGSGDKALEKPALLKGPCLPKVEVSASEDKASPATGPGPMQVMKASPKESHRIGPVSVPEHSNTTAIKSEQEPERGMQRTPGRSDYNAERGKSLPAESGSVDAEQAKRGASTSSAPTPRDVPRKYHGPLFDFPSFTRRHDSMGSANYNSNLSLGYDVKDLLAQEGMIVLGKKREDSLKKISGLLSINLERKRIRPDLVLRLQIEEKKLKLLEHQARLRDEVEQEQQEIMAMPDRIYRKFVRQCERQRVELVRQVQQMQKALREKQLKSVFQWRKKLLEAHWAIRDARITRNRGVAKYHERMLREFSKKKDDDRNKRMEALKNNDVERYRQILLEQQTNVPGDASQRYNVLSSFLTQTEEYLYKLGGKITAAKNQQQVEEAANAAAAAARAQGLSEEEVKAAAQCAGQEVVIRNTFSEMNAPRDNMSDNKYYNLAHAVSERVTKQPSLLRAGILRDYQLVGLQWMLSLYNNKLNGILADEMGLGKTVQVMALIAYLMEFKANYGPHLIIVPNAVLVNWKSELLNWLPSASCIFYVGAKDQRAKLFSQEVLAVKFNVLVTTYEFVMFDRSKLSKIDWKYIIIDEAQRMKDRDSVLARDLDRYRCQRRLLLTGTPLQNDLKELWSLLNLLLPEVFDSSKAFQDWFSKPFQRDGPTHSEEEDDWLETEKKVIVIHRLHQILEPFMLRRRVEDVEGSLPRKDSIVLRCRMSAIQGAIYDWIKSTGTIRVDPEDEKTRAQRNPMYQVKTYKNLNNKCMELRKVCNHPLLSYPFLNYYGKDFMIRSCGKLWNLDRILIKLHKAGHRVLLFSTMTKLLDIMEDYLQWRQLMYRRIDGTTSLEDRESAIVDFNRPNSDCFIFLLSIRAAGRGLNLQSADTVVIYDPDPNPQNEEQAVARAHRIGQTREVKVIYMEAVVDNISSYQKEDELRNGGSGDLEDDLAGKDRYMGSIESLIRNNIQQYKIDMADEVINAGRFDQRTTHEERRMTLETLLHDEERYQETVHDVPSLHEVNRMIARTEEEVELFDQMDEDFDWTGDMMKHNQVPKWLRVSSTEVDSVVASLSKKPSKNMSSGGIALDTNDTPEKRRGRPKGSGKYSIYREIDDEDLEEYDEDSEDRNISSLPEEGEIGEFEDEEDNDDSVPYNKDESEEEEPINDEGYDSPHGLGSGKTNRLEEAGSTGSSSGSRRLPPPAPSSSSKKLRSLSALDSRPGALSKRTPDDLEEGEIALSGDSHMDFQQSGSWNHERDDGEDEQVLQPKIKRKRSIRIRPRPNAEKQDDRSGGDGTFPQRGAHLAFQGDGDYDSQFKFDQDAHAFADPAVRQQGAVHPVVKQKRNMPSRKVSPASRTGKLTYLSGSGEGSTELFKENRSSKAIDSASADFGGTKMSDSMQRKCKNVISKLWRRIDKEGHQIIPNIASWWRRNENSKFKGPASSTLDLQKIEQRVDGFEYVVVSEFIADMQQMLKTVVQHFSYRHEVRVEAETLHNLFFNIMKIAFPDSDFREAKNAISFSNPGGSASSAPSTKHSASGHKRRASTNEVEQHASGHTRHNQPSSVSEVPSRAHSSRSERDSKHSGSGSRDQVQDGAGLFMHPSDLVIVKKKRQDRARSSIGSPSSSGRAGPLSPANPGRVGPLPSPRGARTPFQRDPHPSQQSMHSAGWGAHSMQQSDHGGSASSPGIGDIQWAKPVKRLRTDSGKRRPSHM